MKSSPSGPHHSNSPPCSGDLGESSDALRGVFDALEAFSFSVFGGLFERFGSRDVSVREPKSHHLESRLVKPQEVISIPTQRFL